MAHVRYQVDGVPQDGRAHAWFPQPGLTPAGFSSVRRFISGWPGTVRVPTTKAGVPGVTHSCVGLDSNYNASGTLSLSPDYVPPSAVAPDWFAPQVWLSEINELPTAPSSSGMGIRRLPARVAVEVPPVTPLGTWGPLGPSQVAMGGRKVGGRRSMIWPRVITRWPNLGGEYT